MAKIKCKKKGCQIVISAKLSRDERISDIELKILMQNYMHTLFSAKRTGRNRIEYSGPISVSLSDWLKKPISKNDFLILVEMIVNSIQEFNQKAFAINRIVWDIRNIYINEQNHEIRFIYLPIEKGIENVNLFVFFEELIHKVKPMSGEDSNYIQRFMLLIRSLTNFDLNQIEQYVYKENPQIVSSIKNRKNSNSGFLTDKHIDYYEHYNVMDDRDTGLLTVDDEDTGLLTVDDEDTGVLTVDDEDTGLLTVDDEDTGLLMVDDDATGLLNTTNSIEKFPRLYRLSTDEMIIVNKPVFRIGKEYEYTDYCVVNNSAVSRNHADIVIRGNRYFVIDLNSKNRTFINGTVIGIRQETEIYNGDHLMLANEEFIFYS